MSAIASYPPPAPFVPAAGQSTVAAPTAEADALAASETLVPRVLGRMSGGKPRGQERRPTLICVAGLHGNEPAGVNALLRVFEVLKSDPACLRGQVVGFTGNRKALAQGRRYLVADLNRHWLPERVAVLRDTPGALAAEDEELRELAAELDGVISETRGKLFALDLHTTSGHGLPFATLDDSLRNRHFALELPVRVVLGLEEELMGTLTGYLDRLGVTNLGFEAGQHEDPSSVDMSEAAIWIALEVSGVLRKGSRPEPEEARRRLRELAQIRMPQVVEVRYRHAIQPEDRFEMLPGFRNFDPVSAGQVLSHDVRGPVKAPERGRILMPLYQKQGNDGFFIVRPIHRRWLTLSAFARGLRLERWLHLLPGVERHPERADSFLVDRQTARWAALELFHLLGFHRKGSRADRHLTMSRRKHDR